MRKITLISAYYDNPNMLQKQIDNIKTYPEIVQRNLEIIIVDDCSPTHPASEVICAHTGDAAMFKATYNIRLYRTMVDVPWNQDFCRNLAVWQSKTPWVFLTDIDHLVPGATLENLVKSEDIKDNTAYRFSRVTAPEMEAYKHHPNTWFLTKEMYNQAGGYDEMLAGTYGTDGDFAKRLNRFAPIIMRPEIIIRVPREYIPDASTTRYERRNPADPARKKNISDHRNNTPNWRPLNLSFPWERIC